MKAATFPTLPVLVVDDEEQFLLSAQLTLRSNGINHVVPCQDSREVIALLGSRDFSVVLLDMWMPNVSGRELLPAIVRDFPHVPVVIITALNDVETAVESMKEGAFDYLVKPVEDTRLVTCTRRALEMGEVRSENARLRRCLLSDSLEHPEAFEGIVTRAPAMRAVFQYVEAIARTSLPVLITGETGTGKELVARAVHRLSGREGAFVDLDVAGVDDGMFSDTLFGHRKGAFTGADRERKGLIERAAGGTLFLDEIGDLRPESQVKLLRLLQEGKYYPLGSDMPKLTDARVIVATHRDIRHLQESGGFRRDLFYRLQSHHVHLPPLRERRDDLPLLVDHFLGAAAESLGKRPPTPPAELPALLGAYSFPGNVRELQGMLLDAVSRHQSGVLSLESLRARIFPEGSASEPERRPQEEQGADPDPGKGIAFSETLPTLKEAEQMLIDEALRRSNGNQTIAARMLGMTRRALNNRLTRAGRRQPQTGEVV
jgi:DNA-binding NtrC family response regulator